MVLDIYYALLTEQSSKRAKVYGLKPIDLKGSLKHKQEISCTKAVSQGNDLKEKCKHT